MSDIKKNKDEYIKALEEINAVLEETIDELAANILNVSVSTTFNPKTISMADIKNKLLALLMYQVSSSSSNLLNFDSMKKKNSTSCTLKVCKADIFQRINPLQKRYMQLKKKLK